MQKPDEEQELRARVEAATEDRWRRAVASHARAAEARELRRRRAIRRFVLRVSSSVVLVAAVVSVCLWLR